MISEMSVNEVCKKIAYSTYGNNVTYHCVSDELITELLDLCLFRAKELKTNYWYQIEKYQYSTYLSFHFEERSDVDRGS